MAVKFLLFTALSVISCQALVLVHNAPRKVVKILTVNNGGAWGSWHAPVFCAAHSFATGYNMKVEAYQHNGDDTELNSVLLRCQSLEDGLFGGDIESGEGPWGSWTGLAKCDSNNTFQHFITAFELQVEGGQGRGDDTAADYIKFKCRDFSSVSQEYELTQGVGHGDFGSFGVWSESCPVNSAVCGIQSRIEGPQGSGDDTALNDVKLFCCEE